MKAVKSEIITVPFVPKKTNRPANRKPAEVIPLRPKQMVNGYPVQWASPDGSNHKIPYLQTDKFYTQYPTKGEDIKLPEGTKMATYNSTKRRVEFFNNVEGKGEPIRYVNDSVHSPLPLPRYFSELEKVEEVFEIDFETGELTTGMRIDILPEGTHWKLRLQEFEAQCLKNGLSSKVINFRLQKYLKNLQDVRGVTVEELAAPVPQTVLDAIEFAEEKQRKVAVGGK